MPRLTIYSKAECHLCEEMKAVVKRVASAVEHISVEEIDISGDPALVNRYGLEIPVLMIDGREVAKYRIAEAELLKRLGVGGTG